MGLKHLRLVTPPSDWKAAAKKMAVSATDILEYARAYHAFPEAIKDLSLVIGTTRRVRRYNINRIPFEKALDKITRVSKKKSVGIVFGKESKGLDNQTLGECDWVTTIPSHRDYPSLNLAQAVMIVSFELFWRMSCEISGGTYNTKRQTAQVSKEEIHDILERLRLSLKHLGYERKRSDIPARIIATFYGMFKRAGLIQSEANMLKGLTRRICEKNE